MKRRLLSLFVVAVFVLAMFPMTAMAAPATLIDDVTANYSYDSGADKDTLTFDIDSSVAGVTDSTLLVTVIDPNDVTITGTISGGVWTNSPNGVGETGDLTVFGDYDLIITATNGAGYSQTYNGTFTLTSATEFSLHDEDFDTVAPADLITAAGSLAIDGDALVVQGFTAVSGATLTVSVNGDSCCF